MAWFSYTTLLLENPNYCIHNNISSRSKNLIKFPPRAGQIWPRLEKGSPNWRQAMGPWNKSSEPSREVTSVLLRKASLANLKHQKGHTQIFIFIFYFIFSNILRCLSVCFCSFLGFANHSSTQQTPLQPNHLPFQKVNITAESLSLPWKIKLKWMSKKETSKCFERWMRHWDYFVMSYD